VWPKEKRNTGGVSEGLSQNNPPRCSRLQPRHRKYITSACDREPCLREQTAILQGCNYKDSLREFVALRQFFLKGHRISRIGR
jgi:hypothetical protein